MVDQPERVGVRGRPSESDTVGDVVATVEAARAAVAALDPVALGPERSASLVRAIAGLGKACAAAQARLAAHAAAAHVHRRAGFADGAEWLASVSGTSARAAGRSMAVAGQVEALPTTAGALAAGEVSSEAAAAVAATATVVAGSEERLLDLARRKPLRVVQDEARRLRLEAADRESLAAEQRRARRFSHWLDELGMVRISGALCPADGVALLSRLDRHTERLRRQARRNGVEETWEHHAADALVDLVTATGDASSGAATAPAGRARSRQRDTKVVFVVDVTAFRRGTVEAGEVCHVIHGGPVPVSHVARALAHDDPFVAGVLHDGVAVQHVVHWGRHIPAEIRTALDLGAPPTFQGARCACGCGRRHKLQVDHVEPVAAGGPTALHNLAPRTPTEHVLKTELDRAAGLLGHAERAAGAKRVSRPPPERGRPP